MSPSDQAASFSTASTRLAWYLIYPPVDASHEPWLLLDGTELSIQHSPRAQTFMLQEVHQLSLNRYM